jgi:hypothetical protein
MSLWLLRTHHRRRIEFPRQFLKKSEGFPPLPYELQNLYSADTWTTRVQTATQVCRQWSRPVIERIYFFLVIL